MATLGRTTVLNTLFQHETLTFDDFTKEENLGASPGGNHLQLLVDELIQARPYSGSGWGHPLYLYHHR